MDELVSLVLAICGLILLIIFLYMIAFLALARKMRRFAVRRFGSKPGTAESKDKNVNDVQPTTINMKICPQCGRITQDEFGFCPRCGTDLK